MQSLPTLVPGQLVEARAHAWSVERVTPARACAAVDLAGADVATAGQRFTLVMPFDEVRPLAPSVPRSSGAALVFGRLRRLVADALPWPVPAVARDARLDLHAHQLATCLILRGGGARRVLLADAVGTGKTVQAGLVAAQLMADDPGARVLVAVPASLKTQWQEELLVRFGIEARVVDGTLPGSAAADLPSPWRGAGIAITSFDYVKRVDVLGGLAGTWWDLLVVDEAHHAAGASDRAAGLRAIAARAVRVLLVTATPHDGDPRRFDALLTMGAAGDDDRPVILSREPRRDAAARRRTHRRRLAPSPDEAHAAALLERYLGALARGGSRTHDAPLALLAAVLRKRAASSPMALARTAFRRRDLLGAPPPARQLVLDFSPEATAARNDDAGEEEAWLGVRIAADPRQERAWLGAIGEAARRAAASSRKLDALRRLIARTGEPLIVFTEYRDTLSWLHASLGRGPACGVLHGGQPVAERQAAIAAFTRGHTRLLLATDAAAEGLNLHARCRAVVLFDLPWTPARVEQRIGRVDRIGQARRVHAWTFEPDSPPLAAVASRLEARASAAAAWQAGVSGAPGARGADGGLDEREACDCLVRARAWLRSLDRCRWAGQGPPSGPALARVPARRLAALGAGPRDVFVVVQAIYSHGGQPALERRLFAVCVAAPVPAGPAARHRRAAIAAAACDAARRAAAPAIEARRLTLATRRAGVTRTEMEARAHVTAAVRTSIAAHFAQPGLFDRAPALAGAAPPDLPASLPAGDVSVLVTTPIVLLPRIDR